MAKNTPNNDRQVLKAMLQPGSLKYPFSDTIRKTWDVDDTNLAVIHIAFLHHVEKNNLANKIKWSLAAEDLPQECETVNNLVDTISTYINDYRKSCDNLNDEAAQQLASCCKTLQAMAGITRILQTEVETSLNDYAKVPLRNLVRKTSQLESSTLGVADLLKTLKKRDDEGIIPKRWWDECNKKVTNLTLHIKKVSEKLNQLAGFSEISLRGESANTILRLNNELFQFLQDRKSHKDQAGKFQDILTEEPSIDTIIPAVFGKNGPAQFRLATATSHEYERKFHETKDGKPRNVARFEEVLKKKKWCCYKDGVFRDALGMETTFPHEDEWKIMVDLYKEEGYDIEYAYFPPDCKLKYICKARDDSRVYELSFFSSPSSFGRSLRKKKELAGFLLGEDDDFDRMVDDAMGNVLQPYDISLPIDFLRKTLAERLGASVKAYIVKPLVQEFSKTLKDDLESLAGLLAGDPDCLPDDKLNATRDLFVKTKAWRELLKLRAGIVTEDARHGIDHQHHDACVTEVPHSCDKTLAGAQQDLDELARTVSRIASMLASHQNTDRKAMADAIEEYLNASKNKLPLIGGSLDGWTSIVSNIVCEWNKTKNRDIPAFKRRLLEHAVDDLPVAACSRTDWSSLDKEVLRARMSEILKHQTDIILNDLHFPANDNETDGFRQGFLSHMDEALKDMDLSPYKRMLQDNLVRFYSERLKTTYGRTDLRVIDRIIWDGHDKEALDYASPSPDIKAAFRQRLSQKRLTDKGGEDLDENSLDHLNWALLKRELVKALSSHPEKILEQYDFSMALDEWRIETARKTLSRICETHLIDRLMADDKAAFQRLFFDNSSGFRRGIDETIRTTWGIDKDKKEDLTAVVMSFVNYLTSRNAKALAALRKCLVDEQAPYNPLPFLIYKEAVVKIWRHFKTESESLGRLLDATAGKFLQDRRKYKGERFSLSKLLIDSDENIQREFLLTSPDSHDGEIQNVIAALKDLKSYRLPEDLLDAARDKLNSFLLDDPVAFIQKYDFSNTLEGWLGKRTEDFIHDCPRLLSMLRYNDVTPFLEENKTTLTKIMRKNAPYANAYHVDPQGKTKKVKKEKATYLEDQWNNLVVELQKDDMRVLRNFKYESPLINYISTVTKTTSAKKLNLEILEREAMQEFPMIDVAGTTDTEAEKEPLTVNDEEVLQNIEKMIDLMRKHRKYFGPKSDDIGYQAKLDIYMLTERRMKKEAIIEHLVNTFGIERNTLGKKYDQWKARSIKLVQQGQTKTTRLLPSLNGTQDNEDMFKIMDKVIEEKEKGNKKGDRS